MAWRSTRLFRTNAPYDLISTQAVARRDERGDDRTTAAAADSMNFPSERHVQRLLDREQRAGQRREAAEALRERQAEGALAEPLAQRYWCVGGHRCSDVVTCELSIHARRAAAIRAPTAHTSLSDKCSVLRSVKREAQCAAQCAAGVQPVCSDWRTAALQQIFAVDDSNA